MPLMGVHDILCRISLGLHGLDAGPILRIVAE
jgi:hypothetical protein